MHRITNTKVINNQYNKTVYTAIAGAGLTIIFVALKDYGVDVSTELQGAITTFTMMLTTLFVKNRNTASA
ncbi:MAG: hypothetical protein DHS20C13_02900 [Thermodesulfobacteriota bacterium]|nr:MAG: hypothetical protein DHS20C13_02900 [Thermodesulfobacteriota bacterium]